jgi:hypothetical protein
MERDRGSALGMATKKKRTRTTAAPKPPKVTPAEIEAELGRQGLPIPSDPAELRALARVATGIVWRSVGTPGIPQDLVEAQAIANVVFAYGRRPDPRDVHAPMMPDIIRMAFREKQARVPPGAVVEILAKLAVGFNRESENPLGATGKIVAASAVVDLYLGGA